MIFGSGAQHGRAADVDIFDGGRKIAIGFGDCRLKWVEVYDHQINRGYAVLLHDRLIDIASGEDATMHLRMQRLHAAVHHLGKAGVVGDLDSRDLFGAQEFVGTSGGEDFDADAAQRFGK